MNPRAAINDLHPFQGCPFSLLGTSPIAYRYTSAVVMRTPVHRECGAERMGFEPMRPLRQTVFKTAPL